MRKIRNSGVTVTTDERNEIALDINGITRTDRLILVDRIDGNEWEIFVSGGVIVCEPYNLDDKRDLKIDKILKRELTLS